MDMNKSLLWSEGLTLAVWEPLHFWLLDRVTWTWLSFEDLPSGTISGDIIQFCYAICLAKETGSRWGGLDLGDFAIWEGVEMLSQAQSI